MGVAFKLVLYARELLRIGLNGQQAWHGSVGILQRTAAARPNVNQATRWGELMQTLQPGAEVGISVHDCLTSLTLRKRMLRLRLSLASAPVSAGHTN